jgi:hypothetical protein
MEDTLLSNLEIIVLEVTVFVVFSMKNDASDAVLLPIENFHHDKGVLYPPPLPPPLSFFLIM